MLQLYEHEKEENQRVNQELVACQKELLTVKSDLNRAVRHDSCRNSELADKRVRVISGLTCLELAIGNVLLQR